MKAHSPAVITIAINNYNYAKYLGAAIDSALAQTHPNVEVIVVDDGSADDSRSVIEGYGGKVRSIFKPNGGQGSAYNAGFEAATGSWVLFLDSDDVLLPTACELLAERFGSSVSKVQFPMSLVGPNLEPFGVRMPDLKMPQGDLRELVLRYRAYGSPPGSANCYSKRFLDAVMPMPPEDWRICADSFLILQAPFYGEVRTVDAELGLYRQHRKSEASQKDGAVAGNAYGLSKLINLLDQEDRLVKKVAQRFGSELTRSSNDRNPAYTKNLLCALITGQAPETTPPKAQVAIQGLLNSLRFPMYSPKKRLLGAAWFLVAGFAPKNIALKTVRYALDPSSHASPAAAIDPKGATTV